MLFTQLNGLASQPAESRAEVDVLQDLACRIGPRVDGINAARSLPQSMGAYVTSGAQGACVGRDQQSEQHTTTTMHGFGAAAMAVAPTDTPTTPAPTTAPTTPAPTTGTKPVFNRFSIMASMAPRAMSVASDVKSQPAPDAGAAPGAIVPGADAGPQTYPPGTIAAFASKTNLWRVAVPAGSPTAGFGIFGAAATFTEVAPVVAPPAGATQVTEKVLEDKTGQTPFFKKPLFWAIVAGSVLVVGGGGYWLVRRRRAA